MKPIRSLLALGLSLFLSACVSSGSHYATTVQSWQGGNVQQLIQRWGMPDQRVSNLHGRTLYIYKTRAQTFHTANRAYSPAIGVNVGDKGKPVITETSSQTATSSQPLNCLAVFEVTRQGLIVDAQARGNNCYASTFFVNSMRNPARP